MRLFISHSSRLGAAPVLLVGLAGVLQATSLAVPFDVPGQLAPSQGQTLWWLQLLAMTLFARTLLGCKTPVQAAWLGWLFASAWLSATFAWLYTSMHTFGGLHAVLSVLAVLALAGFLALYSAAVCWSFMALAQYSKWFSAILFASLWLIAEMARGTWLTGFGWGAVGYAHVDGPLAALFSWAGVYGVTAVAALLAMLLAQLAHSDSWAQARGFGLAALVLVLLSWWLPASQSQPDQTISVSLLQGNIAQEEKFQPQSGIPAALNWYGTQLANSSTDLVITPETALAVLPDQLPDGYWQALRQRFASNDQAALVGVPMGSYSQGYTNSVAGFKAGQSEPWRYDKHHLVPFGEFIPPFFRWFTNLMNIPLGDFNRGALPQPTLDWHAQRLAVSICFENLFGEELAKQFIDPDQSPTLLVNVSNLGWFGNNLAMDQHLHIARARSLEFGRAFLLATNTGRTAVVNSAGQITHALPPHTQAVLTAQVQGHIGNTVYANWVSRWGLWPLWLLALMVPGAFLLSGRRRDRDA
ncbi:apolipoprotein N-acyltransferase [Rhodoferax sp.]|uniref:apolipoprotein N-acyltransferase n=1 Tax=Rhodoferax sp. TaxID=50421 RepID=UPI0025CC721A|nr:apolipoprotein N-acyltransferase [Rhodoferax sp.]